jgi:hypothetical protein
MVTCALIGVNKHFAEVFEMAERRAEPLKPCTASFGASYDTFFRAAKDGRLKTIRLGNRLYVPADEIERLSREGLPRRTQRGLAAK